MVTTGTVALKVLAWFATFEQQDNNSHLVSIRSSYQKHYLDSQSPSQTTPWFQLSPLHLLSSAPDNEISTILTLQSSRRLKFLIVRELRLVPVGQEWLTVQNKHLDPDLSIQQALRGQNPAGKVQQKLYHYHLLSRSNYLNLNTLYVGDKNA